MASTPKKSYAASGATCDAAAPTPPRRPRKTLSRSFCDGLEAAVVAEPQDFPGTRPRTMMSLMVRELVKQAGSGRSAPIKTVMGFLRDGEREDAERGGEHEDALSQGISGNSCRAEPRFEWSDGSWDSSEREKTEAQADAAGESSFERLYARFMRAREAELENAAREERRATERDGAAAPPEQCANSGTVSPAGPQIHIAGRVANG